MKLSFRTNAIDDQAHTPSYKVFERDVPPGQAFLFLNKLVSPQDMIYSETPRCSADFWKHEGSLWVEIYSAELWATSQVNDIEARSIIEMLDRGDSFGNCIPMTDREWDAYAPLGDDPPIQQHAT